MNATDLLRELETLAHDARVRRMVALGQAARSDSRSASVLSTLERGDVYARSLALYACYGSGDGGHVLRALAEPSRGVRSQALRLAALVCDDTQAQSALAALPARAQRRLLSRLAARRRSGPVDAFLATLPDTEAGPLLAYASPAVAAARAEQSLERAGANDWRRLARLHPSLAAELLLRRAQAAEGLDQRLRWLARCRGRPGAGCSAGAARPAARRRSAPSPEPARSGNPPGPAPALRRRAPVGAARAALEPFIRNPDPELRALGVATLIAAARFQRERLPEALQLVLERRHEQDLARLAMLERLTHDWRAWVASQALTLIARYCRERLPALVPLLLREDRSWVTQPIVYSYLHRRRQDLLTPFLGQTAYKGRFATGKTRFVLPLFAGFQRWTSRQQASFARLLDQVPRDEQRDSPALFQAINQLAALPAVAPTRILQLAAMDNPRLALRDIALRALGQLDGGQGVPELLAALDDERARIAIYALRRALLELPPEQARVLLRGVSLRRVTVAKEVVRLLGELPAAVAYADLLAITGEELHRDVRVALLRALWGHLERAESWPILEAAARDADPAIAAGVIRIPAERVSAEAQSRLVGLLATLLAHPSPQVRLDTLARCATLPLTDHEQALLPPLLTAVGSALPDERGAAARAVFATYVGRQAGAVEAAVRAIQPNPRALVSLLESLCAQLYWDPIGLRPTVQAVLRALADDPLTATWQVQLAAGGLAWAALLAVLRRLATDDQLHAEATMAAVVAVEQRGGRVDGAGLAVLEAELRAEQDLRLRRIALAALAGLAQPPRGWSPALLEQLAHYRADPAPLVAAAARYTLPSADDN